MVNSKAFTTIKDEMLIDLVRENFELYDLSNRLYSDTSHKAQIWKEIGKKLKIDPSDCKYRWEALRSQFRKFQTKQKTTTGKVASNLKYKYSDHLQFLKPYMKDKNRMSLFAQEEYSSKISESERKLTDDSYLQTEASTSKKKTVPMTPVKPPTKTASEVIMSHLLEQDKQQQTHQKDELNHFFENLKCTVRKFSDQDKHIVKQKLFMTVSEMETKYLYPTQALGPSTSEENCIPRKATSATSRHYTSTNSYDSSPHLKRFRFQKNDCLHQIDERPIVVEESSSEIPRKFSPQNPPDSFDNNNFW